jgi:hypothetical protein
MFLMYPHATVFALFTNEARTVLLKDSLLPSGRPEGKNTPYSRIDSKLASRMVCNASIRQKSP